MRNLISLLLFIALAVTGAQAQSFGIGTDYPNSNAILDVVSTDRGVLLPRLTMAHRTAMTPALGMPEEGLLIYNTTELKFNYWDGTQWVPFPFDGILTADNGLNLVADEVRLGGDLIHNTTIDQGNFSITYDLTGSGNFNVDNSTGTKFIVRNDGRVGIGSANIVADFNVTGASIFSDDITLRDGSVSAGDILAKLFNEDDDGVLELYVNDDVSHRLHANDETVFNERGLSIDFRVETNRKRYAVFVDGTNDLVRFGDNAAGTTLFNGNILNGITLDYVADFQADASIHGTAVGIGSQEFIYDGGNDILATNANIHPVYHLTQDLGQDSMLAWDDVYADAFIMASDTRLKKDIRTLEYGLDEILNIRAVSYTRIDDPFKERKLGILAQQALPLVSEVVKTHDYKLVDETSQRYEKYELPYMGVEYLQLVPILIKATQEQQEIILRKDEDIEKLIRVVKELQTRVSLLEEQID